VRIREIKLFQTTFGFNVKEVPPEVQVELIAWHCNDALKDKLREKKINKFLQVVASVPLSRNGKLSL
jgi:hypothetical protein